jgi:hypothetical protein
MIALQKKPKATQCSNHYAVSLIAHSTKIVAMVLKRRTETKMEEALGEDQF